MCKLFCILLQVDFSGNLIGETTDLENNIFLLQIDTIIPH